MALSEIEKQLKEITELVTKNHKAIERLTHRLYHLETEFAEEKMQEEYETEKWN